MSDPAAQLEALRHLYDAGAFLRCAKPDKSPIGKVKGEHRRRSVWGALVANLRTGGHALYYQPGAQGLLILDFDPMLDDRLDAIADLLGNRPYRSFKSSGKWKEAEGSRPAGFGGHAVWAVDPALADEAAAIRRFSDRPEGDHFGEAFGGHPMFGVVVWDAIALAEATDLDPIERVDPRLLPVARYSLSHRDADGNWTQGEGSRHDAAISEICKAARQSPTTAVFDAYAELVKAAFEASFADPAERDARIRSGEWARIEAHGRALRDRLQSDRAEGLVNHAALMAAIRKGKRE